MVQLCYQDGEFIGEIDTLDQMHTIVDDALKAKGSGASCAGWRKTTTLAGTLESYKND